MFQHSFYGYLIGSNSGPNPEKKSGSVFWLIEIKPKFSSNLNVNKIDYNFDKLFLKENFGSSMILKGFQVWIFRPDPDQNIIQIWQIGPRESTSDQIKKCPLGKE